MAICPYFSKIAFREVVELILERGFDINVRTSRGSALHEAALCGKIDVVKCLLESGINVELRDKGDKTVLEIMDELKTQRTREILHIILGMCTVLIITPKPLLFVNLDHMGIRRRAAVTSAASSSSTLGRTPLSPYDNISLTQSLSESYSIDIDFNSTASASTSRASSRCLDESPIHQRGAAAAGGHSRSVKSVEDLVDRRISSLSTTSG